MSEEGAEIIDELNESADDSIQAHKPVKKSVAHNHFTYCRETDKYTCNYCKKSFKKEPRSSTGNLMKHLKSQHTDKLSDFQKDKCSDFKNPILAAFSKGVSEKDFMSRLGEFIILKNQPFSIVEEDSFRALVSFGKQPSVKMPQRETIKAKIQTMYEEKRAEIKRKLQSQSGSISLVVDCWSSRCGKSFHGILATYIDSDWNYQQVVLDFDILKGSHKGVNLAKSVYDVLVSYGITTKLLAITSDNASNMNTMLKELAKMLRPEVEWNCDDQRVRCLAHIINLACQAALKILKNTEQKEVNYEHESSTDSQDSDDSNQLKAAKKLSIYDRLKRAVTKIRKSNILRDSMTHFCETLKIPKLQLLQDMKVRWNSTLKMLQRCIDLRKALDATMMSDSTLRPLVLSSSDWKIVEAMIDLLKPFSQITNRMSQQFEPLMSLTAASYIDLYNHLESFNEKSCHPCVLSAAKLACDKLNEYYPKSDGLVYVLGIALDPRCKFEWHKSVGFKSLVAGYKATVTKHWQTFYKPNEGTNLEEETTVHIFERQMKRAKFDSKDELEKYLSLPPVKSSDLPNGVLSWWKDHSGMYPNLSKMARDFLGVSATGVPIECLFCMGTDLLTPKRLSMLAETIRICLCLKAWLKFDKRDDFFRSRAEAIVQRMLGEA